jgi:hypothetical protein
MSILAPQGRKPLAADALLRLVRSGFARIPDYRSDDPEIACTDALMAAFAVFSLTSPSLLALDQERTAGNVPTIYGMERAPCATSRRERLDPGFPERLRPLLQSVLRQLQPGKALEPMPWLDGPD